MSHSTFEHDAPVIGLSRGAGNGNSAEQGGDYNLCLEAGLIEGGREGVDSFTLDSRRMPAVYLGVLRIVGPSLYPQVYVGERVYGANGIAARMECLPYRGISK